MQTSEKIEKFSSTALCSFLVLIASSQKWGGENNHLVLTAIPLVISAFIFFYDWTRLQLGWSSYNELKDKKAQQEHEKKTRQKIEDCEKALAVQSMTVEQKKYFQEQLYKLHRSLQRDVSIVEMAAPDEAKK